ncbi:ALP1-like protein isoform X1 [Tanacetum coccineum]|uniref:ALP1-like protein isoform X1 n=1 Tax=Tanacetum coccineum TaxID=301880 RepID=A0ABQ5J6X2_9ASTR
MLEDVASYDLWTWHAFFWVAGPNNNLTVLNNYPLFDNLLDDIAQTEVNGVTFQNGYYLADGITHGGQVSSNHLRLRGMRNVSYLNGEKKVLEKLLKELLAFYKDTKRNRRVKIESSSKEDFTTATLMLATKLVDAHFPENLN